MKNIRKEQNTERIIPPKKLETGKSIRAPLKSRLIIKKKREKTLFPTKAAPIFPIKRIPH
ncbi:MAG: hypothetical protein AB1734_11770 [Elusimicrobiota bacterium]